MNTGLVTSQQLVTAALDPMHRLAIATVARGPSEPGPARHHPPPCPFVRSRDAGFQRPGDPTLSLAVLGAIAPNSPDN
jgi:hypothetical protein